MVEISPRAPLVSVLMPMRNRRQLFDRATRSVLDQSFTRPQVIVCDNNSVDGTENLRRALNDERIEWYRSDTDLSMLNNWSRGLSHIRGDLLVRLDDHNVFIRMPCAEASPF